MESKGLNARNWNTKKGDAIRKGARGHSATPERPERAATNPDRYKEYRQRRKDEQTQLIARKERIWGNVHKYRPTRANKAAFVNPITEKAPDRNYVRRFLRMTDAEIDAIDWPRIIAGNYTGQGDIEWAFLFYH